MIEIFDSKDIFDLMYELADKNNCAYVYFHNDSLKNCSNQDLIDSVYGYYEEFLPEDLLLILKTGDDNIVKFITQDAAGMNALSWFPRKDQLVDESGEQLPEEYYFKCYAIDRHGIFYQN